MRASELVAKLQELIKEHGDREVYSGGEDYPGRVEAVAVEQHGHPYVPKDSFKVWGGF